MSPTFRIVLCFFALEGVFAPLISLAFFAALGLDQGRSIAIGALVVLHLARFATTSLVLVRVLRPLERWRDLPESTASAAELTAAARAAHRAPFVYAFAHTATWCLVFPLATLVLLVFYPERVPLDPHVAPALLFLGTAVMLGPTAYGFPTVEWLLAKEVGTMLTDGNHGAA
jgi:hypothetical protein